MTGVASKNENVAASSWVRSPRSPAPMVTPLRDIPANSAKTCAEPIEIALLALRLSNFRIWTCLPRVRISRSMAIKIIPLMVRKIAAASGFAKSTRNSFSKRIPAIPTGMLPIKIMKRRR